MKGLVTFCSSEVFLLFLLMWILVKFQRKTFSLCKEAHFSVWVTYLQGKGKPDNKSFLSSSFKKSMYVNMFILKYIN